MGALVLQQCYMRRNVYTGILRSKIHCKNPGALVPHLIFFPFYTFMINVMTTGLREQEISVTQSKRGILKLRQKLSAMKKI